MAGDTVSACAAGHVKRGKYPGADFEIFPPRPHFDAPPGDLMAEHERRLLDSVPFHQVAAADPARTRTNQQLPRADLGHWKLLQTHVAVIVVHSNAHIFWSFARETNWPYALSSPSHSRRP